MAFRPRFPLENYFHIADWPLGLRGEDAGDRVDLPNEGGLVCAELMVAIGEEILACPTRRRLPRPVVTGKTFSITV